MHLEEVVVSKLVHGGQALGVLPSGKKVFIWNALPGEKVKVRIAKNHKDYAEGIAEEIIQPASDRQAPKDEAYLSTSPWQIMSWPLENQSKKEILAEAFSREHVDVGDFDFKSGGEQYAYRNKMEYSFWGDDTGLHLALYHRASHGKRIVAGSSIARPEIDKVAHQIVSVLNNNAIRGSQLKTLVLRASKDGQVAAALFVKEEAFPELSGLDTICQGVAVYFSNPKSPASVPTRLLYQYGSGVLEDTILGKTITYDVLSFFQVNLPVFEQALEDMRHGLQENTDIVDMYAGVGTIGLALGAKVLVELDGNNVHRAKQNVADTTEVIQASAETALDYITPHSQIIFDPPRAGLHEKVVNRVLEVLPPRLIYLSCNPATQARDVARLAANYKMSFLCGYNFFPKTPHIESLAILERQ